MFKKYILKFEVDLYSSGIHIYRILITTQDKYQSLWIT